MTVALGGVVEGGRSEEVAVLDARFVVFLFFNFLLFNRGGGRRIVSLGVGIGGVRFSRVGIGVIVVRGRSGGGWGLLLLLRRRVRFGARGGRGGRPRLVRG
ncbi:MAG: hypothetical protein BRD30_12250 [Bacteroidetes bacterium QH_2_63_10]|nr:MAG: hypothetical protein BRD30_12250 [Bacteroidetes bacterium QH_2_63_10]